MSLSAVVRVAALVVLVLSTVASPAAAQDASALRARAQSEAAAGRCDEALAVVAKAGDAAESDAGLMLVKGQCQIRLKRYREAVTSLERARSLDPAAPNVDLSLAIARYHAGDLDGAADALAAARARGETNAELDLYDGLVRLQRADARDAAIALERARTSDPGVEPVASYYAGLAWSSVDDRSRARESLERVVQGSPGTPWAEAAQRALDALDRRNPTMWLRATVGVEFDDNATLQGAGVELPEEITDEADVRAVWWADAGIELFRTDKWAAGVRARYYGNAYGDINELNEEYPGAGIWIDHRMDAVTLLRLEYDYGYAWIGGADPYVSAQTGTLSVIRNWGEAGTTTVRGRVLADNYFFPREDVPDAGAPGVDCAIECGPPGLDEKNARNADGIGFETGVEHGIPLAWNDSTVTGWYEFLYYNSRGREWKYSGHRIGAGFHTDLPFEMRLHALGSYTYRAYENSSTYPNPGEQERAQIQDRPYRLVSAHRRDNALEFDLVIERAITNWLSASVRYNYLWNDSNTNVFHYHRQIVGGYLTVYLHD